MWVFYALITASVVMFAGGFGLQDVYRKKRGSSLKVSMESACIGSVAGLAVLLCIDGFSFEPTAFTVIMAVWAAVNALAFTFCTLRSFEYIDLSVFSLFAMLGGMMLPFLQGILFYGEGFTLAKAICVVLVCLALLCTVEKGARKKGLIFYAGIFVFNGMSGVISKIFTDSDLPKASAAGYSVWIAAVTALLSGIIWLALSLKERRTAVAKDRLTLYVGAVGALQGIINKVGNFLLVFALAKVDTSVQYPMVTGGTIIFSTLFSLFSEKKPDKKAKIGVAIAFAGMLALFLIPV